MWRAEAQAVRVPNLNSPVNWSG